MSVTLEKKQNDIKPKIKKPKRDKPNKNLYFPKQHKNLDCTDPKSSFSYVWVQNTGDSIKMFPKLCKRWQCKSCSKIMRNEFIKQVNALIREVPFRSYVTLTLDHKDYTPSKSDEKIKTMWKRMRTSLARKFGNGAIKFLAITEFQESRHAHLHILINKELDQNWVEAKWVSLGGGTEVDCQPITSTGTLSEYLSKEFVKPDVPAGLRRFSKSRCIKIDLSMKKNGKQDKPSGKWTMWAVPNVPEFDSGHLDRPTGKDKELDTTVPDRPSSARNTRHRLAAAFSDALDIVLKIKIDLHCIGIGEIGLERIDWNCTNARAPAS